MAKFDQLELLDGLAKNIEEIYQLVNHSFTNQSDDLLNWKPNPTTWSVLDCLEHLNIYSRFYIPHIQKQMQQAKPINQQKYNSSWLGDYFVKTLSPNNQKAMSTLKRLNPIHSSLDADTVITNFLHYQQHFLENIQTAEKIDLTSIKIPLEFMPMLRLRLGDVFRFLVAHEQRHILQANRVLEQAIHENQGAENIFR